MSEDTDDRMERAERIRELREQGGGAQQTEAEGMPSTDSDAGDAGGDSGEAAASATPGEIATGTGGGAAGLELPDQEQIEDALDEAGGDAASAEPAENASVGRTARGQANTTTEARTRVLEFELGDELFCIDIAGLEEIVKRETVTRVPNTQDYVEGVVDLRGQITTILDAKRLLEMDAEGAEELIVVFAPDAYEEYGAVGWIVDEVRQVRPVTDDKVREPPTDDNYVEGIVDREEADELVVWVRPERAMSEALAEDDDE